jgi:hypothetical protein
MTNNNNYYENNGDNESSDNESSDNDSSDNDSSDNESLNNDDQQKCEFIANSEHLFDTDYYATFERDNTYYLTIPYLNENNYLKDLHISSRGFFNHSLQSVQNYIREYTVSSKIPDKSSFEIVKTSYIQLPGGFTLANVIIKTFWLRIVQRRWRNVIRKRNQMIFRVVKDREYGMRRQQIPTLRGCMADMK